jgi:hypothetical protein
MAIPDEVPRRVPEVDLGHKSIHPVARMVQCYEGPTSLVCHETSSLLPEGLALGIPQFLHPAREESRQDTNMQ